MPCPSPAETLSFATANGLVGDAKAPERLPVLMQRSRLALMRQPLARQIAAAERRHTSFARALLPAVLAAALVGLLVLIALAVSPLSLDGVLAGWVAATTLALMVAIPVAFKMMLAAAVLRAQLATCAPASLIREDLKNCPSTQLFLLRAASAKSGGVL